ncbi:MAG TPA: DinB family protein [Thermoanaerobaculia bacterium]
MNFHPQQITALEYLCRKGTEAAVPQLYGHVAKTFQDFEAYLHTVPVALRGAKPSPQAWSAHEVIDHLVESHRPAVEQLRSLAAGKRPETAPIPASLQSENPFQRSWEDLVAELRGIHRSYLALIEGASEATDAKTPVVMVIKIDNAPVTWETELDWKAYAQAFRVHTVEHKAQIERTLVALAAPLSPG